MEHTRAFIRELLKLVNMNVGPLKEDIQELYYKANEEMEEVSIQNKEKIEIQQETINTLEYQILLLEEDIELKLDLIENLHEEG